MAAVQTKQGGAGLDPSEIRTAIARLKESQAQAAKRIEILEGLLKDEELLVILAGQGNAALLDGEHESRPVEVEQVESSSSTQIQPKLRGGTAVLHAMGKEPQREEWRPNDVAEILDSLGIQMRLSAIRVAMGRLVDSGDLERLRKGVYVLKASDGSGERPSTLPYGGGENYP